MEAIRNNFGLKLLAVGLALVGWAYFRFAANPILAAGPVNQQLSVPIAVANLSLGYVARFTDHEAVATVITKRGDPAIKPDEMRAVLNLANKGAGVYNVPVALVAPELVVQSLSPASVTLTIEKIEERSFPIALHYVGEPSRGIVVSATRIRPSVAIVRAATSALAQISAVNANVALPDQPREVDEMLRPVAVDGSGAEVSGVTVSPDLVRVQMRVEAATK